MAPLHPCSRAQALMAVASAVIVAVVAGCAGNRPQLQKALLADTGAAARSHQAGATYLAACPDLLEVLVDKRPDLSGRRQVGLDGRIRLSAAVQPRVEGKNTEE